MGKVTENPSDEMCRGVREIYHICGHNIATLTSDLCTAGYHNITGCNASGFDEFVIIRRTKPDICPECQSIIYRALENKYGALIKPVKDAILNLDLAAATTKDSRDNIARIFRDTVEASTKVCKDASADEWSKHAACGRLRITHKMQEPLREFYAKEAEQIAEDRKRKEVHISRIREVYLVELEALREKHCLYDDDGKNRDTL